MRIGRGCQGGGGGKYPREVDYRRLVQACEHPIEAFYPVEAERRIDEEHRLVYLVTDKEIVILAARYHY
ncbi:type II toxin-antitoxin system YoeB family toxin [Streptomyces virginiae]|uniref:type II toxin-antitoxin system YoeB family toxin n=1 Tax=Streptomyces virginiae TaxID=1961 RepID=UPI000A464389